MTRNELHPLAPHHLPPFIAEPGHADWLFVVTGFIVVLAIVGIGVFYFRLHALPEHMAHRGQKVQFEIVAVLALIALFTHNHAFWIAALLLALVPLPDFSSPLSSMAQSLSRMAGRNRANEPPATIAHAPAPDEPVAAAATPGAASHVAPADARSAERTRA